VPPPALTAARLARATRARLRGTLLCRFQRIDVEGAPLGLLAELRGLPGVAAVSSQQDGAARIEVNEDGATAEVLRRLVDGGRDVREDVAAEP
jgi:hypothetical protein